MDRPVRIGNCSGFFGDRMSALAEIVRGGPVDVVTGDYLAEVTMLILARNRLKKPDGGYASTFLRQLEPVIGEIAERGIRVVVNAGGLDPAGLAAATRELLDRCGVELSVAHVEGDDIAVAELLADGYELAHLDTGEPFSRWGHDPLTANAYLGGFGIKAALASGADIVITGRVADASLVTGAAAWWWDWERSDYHALAGAVVAGHLIECGAQATGGNFSGFAGIADLTEPGFPLAEVDRDGTSVITKHHGTGGAVTVDTVTAQLLYEIGPPAYLNPDVVARLDTVRLDTARLDTARLDTARLDTARGDTVRPESAHPEAARVGTAKDAGPDRVRISGVVGVAPPPDTKVSITGIGGWRNSTTFVLTGLDVDAKADLVEAAVRARLDGNPGIEDLRFTRIGLPAADPADQMVGSSLLHVSVDGDQAIAGRSFSALCVELALSNYPGIYGMGVPGAGGPFGVYWPTLVPQRVVDHTVVHADGRREAIPPPPITATTPTGTSSTGTSSTGTSSTGTSTTGTSTTGTASSPLGSATGESAGTAASGFSEDEPTIQGPLGKLVHARSGDKGGNANVGLWVTDDAAWPWLRTTMTVEKLRELLPEVAALEIGRYELPNLRALNFVIKGLLDGGATEARRFDKQAKALGEWLRARHVSLPVRLVSNALS